LPIAVVEDAARAGAVAAFIVDTPVVVAVLGVGVKVSVFIGIEGARDAVVPPKTVVVAKVFRHVRPRRLCSDYILREG